MWFRCSLVGVAVVRDARSEATLLTGKASRGRGRED